jgi:hypothetical protein
LLKPSFDLVCRCRANHAPADQRPISGEIGRERGRVHHIRDCQPAARLQHPECFAEHLGLVRDEVDDAVRENDICRVIRDRKMFDFAEAKLHVMGANLGLGCGNPQAIAAMQPGETVVDLGSGAGFDCFLAAKQVGPSGHVIGIDMTNEMLAKARENAAKVNAQYLMPPMLMTTSSRCQTSLRLGRLLLS